MVKRLRDESEVVAVDEDDMESSPTSCEPDVQILSSFSMTEKCDVDFVQDVEARKLEGTMGWPIGVDDRSLNDGCETLCSSSGSLLIIDWDDTLLPSSWLRNQGLTLMSRPDSEQQDQLQTFTDYAIRTLGVAKRLAKVVIVTNAEWGWVELSCARFMPTLLPMLESVKVVSARSTLDPAGKLTPLKWKCEAFLREITNLSQALAAGQEMCVTSVGDSEYERKALRLSASKFNTNCRRKSVKLTVQPTLSQLVREHVLLADSLVDILRHDGNLDIFLC